MNLGIEGVTVLSQRVDMPLWCCFVGLLLAVFSWLSALVCLAACLDREKRHPVRALISGALAVLMLLFAIGCWRQRVTVYKITATDQARETVMTRYPKAQMDGLIIIVTEKGDTTSEVR